MKLFISADIEGTTGIAHWDETEPSQRGYDYFSKQMTREVSAVCDTALKCGATKITVKDAHDTARNIDPAGLPESVEIIRGWARNPLIMMAGIDESYDGVIFTGYHSAGGTAANPMAHTMHSAYEYIKINDALASEFLINTYTAAYFGVPVLMITGDKGVCEEAKTLIPGITTVAVCEGYGNAMRTIHPDLAIRRIQEGVKEALSGNFDDCLIELPRRVRMGIRYREHFYAYRGSFYPDAMKIDSKTIAFESDDYMDVLTFFMFVSR